MKNKTLGSWLVVPIALAFFTGIFQSAMSFATSEMLYMIAGLGMFVFGIWASIRLINSEDKK